MRVSKPSIQIMTERSTRKNFAGSSPHKMSSKPDPDKDGTLDKAEYEAIAANRFQAADPDHDGTLDKKELGSPAGKALMRLLQ